MPGDRMERRLAAVLAADVAGYSRLMGADEQGTLAQLKACRKSVVDPAITEYKGRIVKTTGDGMLVEFASSVDAVTCAVAVQEKMAERDASGTEPRIVFRIGINVGDIIIDGDDIFGDGVNVAARVESECEPGGVCISGNAFEQLRGKTNLNFVDLGEKTLKNIERPVRLYAVRGAASATPATTAVISTMLPDNGKSLPLSLPDKPSIAVLPFQNMSGHPEQEYFADGVVEDIITALSRFKSLFVIARNSSFTYKGKAVDIRQVGRDLGVRYVLEGSVRKSGEAIRINGQLIDASTGVHVWAEKFDCKLSDVFAVQDEVTEKVAAAIEPAIKRTEIEAAVRRGRPNSLSAYDLYLRGLPRLYSMTREGIDDCIELAYRALEIDPRYGAAAVLAAECRGFKFPQGWTADEKSELEEIDRLFRLAINIDENDPEALARLARMMAYTATDHETAAQMVDKAVAINPNSAKLWDQRGWVYMYHGVHLHEAITSFERAVRLSPLDPMMYQTFAGMGFALAKLGRFEDAVTVCKRAALQNKTFSTTYRCLAAALAHLGRDAEAKDAAARLLELEPNFRVSTWMIRVKKQRASLLADGLRKAGLPE